MRFRLPSIRYSRFTRSKVTVVSVLLLVVCLIFLSQANFLTSSTPASAAQDEAPLGRGKGRLRGCPRCASPGEHEIYAPLVALSEAQSSELVFNSRSPKELAVTPIFYKRDGTRILGEAVKIESAEIRYVDVRKLIPPAHRGDRDWGGIGLAYHGIAREMWAQLRFLDVNGGGNVDEFFVVKAENRSDVQEAVWWAPPKSTSIIALGNVTGEPTGAKVTFGNGEVQSIQLAPNGTQIIRRQNSKDVESVRIDITGMPGSIIPTGVITTKGGSFNSVIRFYDTKNTRQPHLFANGLRLAEVTPHLVLKNTSTEPVTAQANAISLAGAANVQPITLPAVQLTAGETRELDLSSMTNKAGFEVASLKVSSSGPPGSLIGSIHSIGDRSGLSYDTPLRDTGAVRAMTGSYPWKVTNDFNTLIYITNVSDQEADFMGEINYRGGRVILDPRKLESGQTAVFDMRKIRDEEMGDSAGRKVSRTASSGQFKWSVRGVTNGKHLLIGRAEMVSRSQRVSTSYSCTDPCPPFYGAEMTPYPPPTVFVNSQGNATIMETAFYDSGYQSGPFAVWADWSLSAAISSLNPDPGTTTTLTGTDPGGATLEGFVGIQTDYGWDGLNCLEYGTYEERDQGPTATRPTITGANTMWWFNGATPASYASQISIVLSTENTGNSYSWSVVSGTNKVTLQNQNTANVTLTSAGKSDSANDVGIQVVVDGQVSAQFNLTIRAPHRLVPGVIAHTSHSSQGYRTEIVYSIRDNFNNLLPGQPITVNEDFTTGVVYDFPGSNWQIALEASDTVNIPQFADVITGDNLTRTPVPQAPQNPIGETKVCHWTQDHYIGSTTIGAGRRVQTNTHQKYRDHAMHENIVSPIP
jgi:hypothetical protein